MINKPFLLSRNSSWSDQWRLLRFVIWMAGKSENQWNWEGGGWETGIFLSCQVEFFFCIRL